MILADGTTLREARIDLGRVALHVAEAGPADGPPVILLHGFPEFGWGWRHQIGALATAGFRVIVPDGRGYGLSDKPDRVAAYRLGTLADDVVALVDALGLARVDLVGHDWGGIVAWAAAACHPGRIGRLAILNAPHPDTTWRVIRRDPVQLLRSWYVAFFQIPRLPERLLSAGRFALLARALTRSSRPDTFSNEDLDRYCEAWARPGALSGMLAWYRALIRHRPRPVGRVAAPTLILWGRRDTALGPRFATESLALCDDGRVLWFAENTHWLQHEEPLGVNVALLAHLGPASRAGLAPQ